MQNMDALELANVIRCANADLKRGIRNAGADAASIVASILVRGDLDFAPPGALRIRALLLAIPGFGERRVRRMLGLAGVFSGDRKLRELTDRQRRIIASVVQGGDAC